jgi:hypothetical protein
MLISLSPQKRRGGIIWLVKPERKLFSIQDKWSEEETMGDKSPKNKEKKKKKSEIKKKGITPIASVIKPEAKK